MDEPIRPRDEPISALRPGMRSYTSAQLMLRVQELEEENLKLLRDMLRLIRENKRLRGRVG